MPAFTPGPWKHELIHGAIDIFPASNTDSDIATVYDLSEEGEANARLIAKAPAMYELLKDILYDESSSQHMETILRVTAYIEGREITEEELIEYGFTD